MNMAFAKRLVFLISAVLLALGFAPTSVHAYGGVVHEYLGTEASKVFPFPALEAHIDWVNAEDEDHVDHIFNHTVIPTCTHFWLADETDLHATYYIPFEDSYCANAYMKADELFDGLFEYWQAQDWQNVYEYLGHVAHLIADMTVPAHAHKDLHPEFDSYDDGWTQAHYDTVTANDALADGGAIVPPDDAVQYVLAHPEEGYDLGWNSASKAKFFYLIYTAQQVGDYSPSDNVEGNTDERFGWMHSYANPPYPVYLHNEDGDPLTQNIGGIDDNWWYEAGGVYVYSNYDGDFTTLARTNMAYAIRAMAGFFKVFRDTFDAVAPVTTETVTYEYPPNQGWTRGWVNIALAATDDVSGLHDANWTLDGDEQSQLFNAERTLSASIWPSTGIVSEGVHEYSFSSRDWFGNAEASRSLTISIDTTPPVVNSTSPTLGGFYLTSDTLTIDWDVTDARSGVASVTATVDGAPVHEGDVLDLDAWGGFHTFVLTATDVAGNVTEQTVEFSVKIDATVAFKPNSVNVKSGGQSVATFTEFPAGYDVAQIDVDTAEVVFKNWMIQAESAPTAPSDFDRDSIADWMIQFPRGSLIYAVTYDPPGGGFGIPVPLVVRGTLYDGTEFWGQTSLEFTHAF
jgi:hypothetical protein